MPGGPTKCHVSERDLETSIMRRPWTTKSVSLKKIPENVHGITNI